MANVEINSLTAATEFADDSFLVVDEDNGSAVYTTKKLAKENLSVIIAGDFTNNGVGNLFRTQEYDGNAGYASVVTNAVWNGTYSSTVAANAGNEPLYFGASTNAAVASGNANDTAQVIFQRKLNGTDKRCGWTSGDANVSSNVIFRDIINEVAGSSDPDGVGLGGINEWNLSCETYNYSPNSDCVGLSSVVRRAVNGSGTFGKACWGLHVNMQDQSDSTNPTGAVLGAEFSMRLANTDANKKRIGLDMVVKRYTGLSVAEGYAALRIRSNDDTASTGYARFINGIVIQDTETLNPGTLNSSKIMDNGILLKTQADYGIKGEGDGGVGISLEGDYTTNALQITGDCTEHSIKVTGTTTTAIAVEGTHTNALQIETGDYILFDGATGTRKMRYSSGGNSLELFNTNVNGAIACFAFQWTATPNIQILGTQVLAGRETGWTALTGTASKAGFDTSTATLTNVAEWAKAIDDLLRYHGILGT